MPAQLASPSARAQPASRVSTAGMLERGFDETPLHRDAIGEAEFRRRLERESNARTEIMQHDRLRMARHFRRHTPGDQTFLCGSAVNARAHVCGNDARRVL